MDTIFTPEAWEEYGRLVQTDVAVVLKIHELIRSIQRDPFKGIGKLEPLKQNLKGYWSRRITQEHRLVYAVEGTKGVDQRVTITQCMFHYSDK